MKNNASIDSASVSDVDVDSRRKRVAAGGASSLDDLVLIRQQDGSPSIFDGIHRHDCQALEGDDRT